MIRILSLDEHPSYMLFVSNKVQHMLCHTNTPENWFYAKTSHLNASHSKIQGKEQSTKSKSNIFLAIIGSFKYKYKNKYKMKCKIRETRNPELKQINSRRGNSDDRISADAVSHQVSAECHLVLKAITNSPRGHSAIQIQIQIHSSQRKLHD